MEMISIKEAAELTGKSSGTIRDWHKKGYIRGTKDKILKVYKEDLVSYIENDEKKGICNPFGVAFPRENESFKPLYTLKQGYIYFPKKTIMIGSLGTIWNITHKHIYEENAIDTNGHIQIRIDGVLYYLHRLVAMLWCANRRFKQIVHHINGITTDNRNVNLLWVTYNEHLKLHELLDACKSDEYDKMVSEIQADNQWQNEILYSVIDTETSNDYWLDVYMTNYEGYCLLLQGFGIEELMKKQLIHMEYGCKNQGKKAQTRDVEMEVIR